MNRLTITQETTADGHVIRNESEEIIGFVARRRCGQFMQYGLEIPPELMKECIEKEESLIFFPGCLDEIRAKCKELKSKELKKYQKGKKYEGGKE